jgi:hypothetical protein
MRWGRFAIAAVVLLASAASAQDVAEAARQAMRHALRDQAPSPTHAPLLPDRAMPGDPNPRMHMAAAKRSADRAARAHAAKNGTRHADSMRSDAANRAAMDAMMDGSTSGCDAQRAADMMKSRGMMPGGGMMGPRGPGDSPPGGMPGGGMHRLKSIEGDRASRVTADRSQP